MATRYGEAKRCSRSTAMTSDCAVIGSSALEVVDERLEGLELARPAVLELADRQKARAQPVEVPRRQAVGGAGRVAEVVQVSTGVVPYRVEQSVPGGIGRRLDDDQRLVGQRPHQLGHVVGVEVIGGQCRRGRLQVEAGGEDAQATQRRLLGLGQQLVAPVEERFERALALGHRPVATPQEPESILQAGVDLGRREHRDPRRRQLDRQREAVETPADAGHGRVVGRRRRRHHGPRWPAP